MSKPEKAAAALLNNISKTEHENAAWNKHVEACMPKRYTPVENVDAECPRTAPRDLRNSRDAERAHMRTHALRTRSLLEMQTRSWEKI
jgi:hypothetical protein